MSDESATSRPETHEEAIARISAEHCDMGGGMGSKVKSNRHFRNRYAKPDIFICDTCSRTWPIPAPKK